VVEKSAGIRQDLPLYLTIWWQVSSVRDLVWLEDESYKRLPGLSGTNFKAKMRKKTNWNASSLPCKNRIELTTKSSKLDPWNEKLPNATRSLYKE
jgi:hypothetical protein